MGDGLERAVAFQRELVRREAEVAIPSEHGTAYLTPSLPRVYDLNQLLIDQGASASAAELIGEADEILGSYGLEHRKVAIDDGLGTTVAKGFREAGWQAEELVVMPHAGPTPPVDLSAVEEVAPEALVPAWETGMRGDIPDEETVAQLVRARLGGRDRVDVRYFATWVDGRIASHCELFSDGRIGQIESVMTGKEFRGRGLGKAVVAGALEASRAVHDFTFIVADAHDWPKELYRRLGFEPVGVVYRFLLRPQP